MTVERWKLIATSQNFSEAYKIVEEYGTGEEIRAEYNKLKK